MAKVIHYAGADLYPKQRAALYDPARISVIEASSKAGKTVGALAWQFEQAATGPALSNHWWVAPVFSQADIAFRRMCEKLPRSYYRKNESKLFVKLVTGQTIWFKSGERCYDDQTEVLTDAGWRLFQDLNGTEQVLTLNMDCMEAEWQRPTAYLDEHYVGPMYEFKSEKVDLLVTPGHRFPVVNRNGDAQGLLTIDQMADHDKIPRRVGWKGEDNPALTEDECALMGIFLAEGSAAGCSGGTTALANGDYTIHFSQTPGMKGGDKGDVRQAIIDLLERLHYSPKLTPEGVFVRSKELWLRLAGIGNRYTKRIPNVYKNLPPAKLAVLLHWMVLGDGTYRKGRIERYYTVNPLLAGDVQEVAIKAGLSATVSSRTTIGGVNAKGVQIAGTRPICQVTFHVKRFDYIKSSTRRYVREVDGYNGRIYCVTVPNHVLMVRRHGHIAWSGNSDDLYGEDVYSVVMDEASRMREESWHAIRSTITYTQASVRMIGNVKGRKNFFYRLAREAEAGTPDMAYHRITCWDAVEAGVLDREEIEASFRDFKRLGREGAWRQLYMAEAADDGDNPFGLEAIEACVVEGLSDGYAKAAGVDLAGRGAVNLNPAGPDEVADRDYTAVVMLDRDGYATHISRFRDGHTGTANRVQRIVKATPALVDSTGAGDAVVESLQRRSGMRVQGYTFTDRSRQDLLEGLALALGEEGVHFPDGWLRDELDLFEFRYSARGVRWAVPDGEHDDGAMALALANKRLPKRRRLQPPVGVRKPEGSLWRGDGEAVGRTVLGEQRLADDPESRTSSVPLPVVVGGGGASRWNQPG